MKPELFIGMTAAVFIANVSSALAIKLLLDWQSRRSWMRMEARLFEQARRLKRELDADTEPPRRQTTIYPKVRAN